MEEKRQEKEGTRETRNTARKKKKEGVKIEEAEFVRFVKKRNYYSGRRGILR